MLSGTPGAAAGCGLRAEEDGERERSERHVEYTFSKFEAEFEEGAQGPAERVVRPGRRDKKAKGSGACNQVSRLGQA